MSNSTRSIKTYKDEPIRVLAMFWKRNIITVDAETKKWAKSLRLFDYGKNDLAQELFLHLLKAAEQQTLPKDHTKEPKFIRTVTANFCVSILRKRRAIPRCFELDETWLDSAQDVYADELEGMSEAELLSKKKMLVQAIQLIENANQRTCLTLRHIDGFTDVEIMDVGGYPSIGSVQSHISRGNKVLKKNIETLKNKENE